VMRAFSSTWSREPLMSLRLQKEQVRI
jgi:hypothetical protein